MEGLLTLTHAYPPPIASGYPVGGRLALNSDAWRSLLPNDRWILTTVSEGLQITFWSPPPLRHSPVWTRVPGDQCKADTLIAEVSILLQKDATEVVAHPDSRHSTAVFSWSPNPTALGGRS